MFRGKLDRTFQQRATHTLTPRVTADVKAWNQPDILVLIRVAPLEGRNLDTALIPRAWPRRTPTNGFSLPVGKQSDRRRTVLNQISEQRSVPGCASSVIDAHGDDEPHAEAAGGLLTANE